MRKKTKHIKKYLNEQISLAELAFMERIEKDDITDEQFITAKNDYQNALFAFGFVKFQSFEINSRTKRVAFVIDGSLQGTEGKETEKKFIISDSLSQFLEEKFQQIEKIEMKRKKK